MFNQIMVRGMHYYLRQAWKKPDMDELRRRMIEWRKSETIVKVETPLRLDKAHALGYKAKKGVIVVRVRIRRGGRKKSRAKKGRRSKRSSIRKDLKMNYKEVAEQRANAKYPNMEVLNSYWIGKDGVYYFFEVILVDGSRKEIQNDKELKFIARAGKGRSYRGLTSSGKKARGLRSSVFEAPKVRPSLRAHERLGR